MESKNWKRPSDVIRDFNTARTIGNNRAIFLINRNDYRLIAEINYQKGWVFIKFIGTHAAYDKWMQRQWIYSNLKIGKDET